MQPATFSNFYVHNAVVKYKIVIDVRETWHDD